MVELSQEVWQEQSTVAAYFHTKNVVVLVGEGLHKRAKALMQT